MNWESFLKLVKSRFEIGLRPKASKVRISEFSAKYGPVPEDLLQLYSCSNGIIYESFSIFPLFLPDDPKRTWESVERNNTISTCPYFKQNSTEMAGELLSRFLIFAEIGHRECAAIDRTDFSIWFQQNEEFSQTNLDLSSFIEICLKEAHSSL